MGEEIDFSELEIKIASSDKVTSTKSKGRKWKGVDLVAHFRENYSDVGSREELQKRDNGFYRILCNKKNKPLFDELLPSKRPNRRSWSGVDLALYFKENYSDVGSREELEKRDPGFYKLLCRKHKPLFDELLPSKRPNRCEQRDWDGVDLALYFKENHSDVGSRKELQKRDNGFYSMLSKEENEHLLDELLPSKRPNRRSWFGVDLALYFKENYSDVGSREELKKRDVGFHSILCKKHKHLLDVLFPKQASSLDSILESYVAGESNE